MFYLRLLNTILWLTEKAFGIEYPEPDPVTAVISHLEFQGLVIEGELFYMELREGQEVDVSAGFKTRGGRAAQHQAGSGSWESSDPSVASVTADPADELKAVVRGENGEANGSAVITFRADGDPDEGEERALVATLDVVVTRGEAHVAEITAGTARDVADAPAGGGGAGETPSEEPGGSTGGETPAEDPGTSGTPGTDPATGDISVPTPADDSGEVSGEDSGDGSGASTR